MQRMVISNYTRDLPGLLIAGAPHRWLLGGFTGLLRRDLRAER